MDGLVIYSGAAIRDHVEELGHMRVAVFRDYPYLYDGRMEDERRHLSRYAESPDSLMVAMYDTEGLVGACTGVPLALEGGELARLFLEESLEETYYIAEIVVRHGWRGQGLGTQLFSALLQAVDTDRYKRLCLCMVERAAGDPRRPADYKSPASLALRFGFVPDPSRTVQFHWKDVGEDAPTEKTMRVWVKAA